MKKKFTKFLILHTNSLSFLIKRYEAQLIIEVSFNTLNLSSKSELFTLKSKKTFILDLKNLIFSLKR